MLADIAAFLEQHPDEVLTIIYQDDLPADRVVADLEASGLAARVYTHEAVAASGSDGVSSTVLTQWLMRNSSLSALPRFNAQVNSSMLWKV